MRHRHNEVFVHLVWGTWDRLPLLSAARRNRLYACMIAECERLGVTVLASGGTADHVHMLIRLPVTVTVGALMNQVKGVSSHLANYELPPDQMPFKWQGGYAAISVSPGDIARVRSYIARQQEHHATGELDQPFELTVESQAQDQ